MPKSWTDQAIVLRTYNVGETDRFCLLLTEQHGRIAARANGVRRLLSRRGSGLLPLHHVNVVCETHSFGFSIASAHAVHTHAPVWQHPHAFSCAQQGIELLLHLTEEGLPIPQVFHLTCEFIAACSLSSSAALPPVFTLKLLTMLGLCPSLMHSCTDHRLLKSFESVVFSRQHGGLVCIADDPAGLRLSPAVVDFFKTVDTLPLAELSMAATPLLPELTTFVHCLTGSQLGLSLRAADVSLAMSSGVTPT